MYRTSAIIQILRDFPGGICRKKPEHLKAVVKEYLKSKRRGTNHAGEIKRGSLQSKHGSSKIRTCYIYMGKCKRNRQRIRTFVIKPSGVDYDLLTPDDMVVVDLNGNKVEGKYNPSSDTATHVELYKAFPNIGGVVHTHSSWATSWAQAGRSIPCYGTTHADYIYGEVPCARCLEGKEFEEYEKNTGLLIVDLFKDKDYEAVPAVLRKNHGPFAWGKDAHEAVHNAVVLEEVAKMASRCELINPQVKPAPQDLQDKHYFRKHGANAYYGQGNK